MICDMIQIGSQGVITNAGNSGEKSVTQKITNVSHESECQEGAEYQWTVSPRDVLDDCNQNHNMHCDLATMIVQKWTKH